MCVCARARVVYVYACVVDEIKFHRVQYLKVTLIHMGGFRRNK